MIRGYNNTKAGRQNLAAPLDTSGKPLVNFPLTVKGFDKLSSSVMKSMLYRLGCFENGNWDDDENVRKSLMLLAGCSEQPDWVKIAHMVLL